MKNFNKIQTSKKITFSTRFYEPFIAIQMVQDLQSFIKEQGIQFYPDLTCYDTIYDKQNTDVMMPNGFYIATDDSKIINRIRIKVSELEVKYKPYAYHIHSYEFKPNQEAAFMKIIDCLPHRVTYNFAYGLFYVNIFAKENQYRKELFNLTILSQKI